MSQTAPSFSPWRRRPGAESTWVRARVSPAWSSPSSSPTSRALASIASKRSAQMRVPARSRPRDRGAGGNPRGPHRNHRSEIPCACGRRHRARPRPLAPPARIRQSVDCPGRGRRLSARTLGRSAARDHSRRARFCDRIRRQQARSRSHDFRVRRLQRPVHDRCRSLPARPPGRKAGPAPSPRVLVLANQKGGVGKTTTAINLGTALAAIGERVLIIDLDPQGNASTGLGIDRKSRTSSSYDALVGERSLAQIITPTAVPRLFIAPSTMDLLGVELEISGHADRSYKLKNAMKAFFAHDNRDDAITYVLIDCPPSLNLLTINALAAADAVLVPLQCEFFALEGLSQLLKTVDQVRRSLNPSLTIHGIVLTMFDPRNSARRPGRRRRARVHGGKGLRHGHSPQRPGVRGALARQAGAALRPQMHGQPSLSETGFRSDPTRRALARRLSGPERETRSFHGRRRRPPRRSSPAPGARPRRPARRRRGRGVRAAGAAARARRRSNSCVPIRAIPARTSPKTNSRSSRPRSASAASSSRCWCAPIPRVADAYEIVAGERRWRAAQRAGLHEIPILVVEAGDREALEIAIVENVQRTDLNALEEAQRLCALGGRYNYSHNDIARIIGKSRSHIANTLRLMKLPDFARALLASGADFGRSCARAAGGRRPGRVADQHRRAGLTVRDVERLWAGRGRPIAARRRPERPGPSTPIRARWRKPQRRARHRGRDSPLGRERRGAHQISQPRTARRFLSPADQPAAR